MKKAISLLLSILMIAVGVVPAMATETDEIHEIFSVSDEELFSDTFGVSASTYSINNVSNNGVIYDYNVTLEEDGTYSASMEFDVVINGIAHRATAFGTLDAIELDNGNIYLSGPLDGNIEVGNHEYKIIVGFQTEYGSDEISAGITLENENILHFAFGEYELSDANFEKIYSSENTQGEVSNNCSFYNEDLISTTSANNNYTFKATDADTYNGAIINTIKLYYNDNEDLLAGLSIPNSNTILEVTTHTTAKVYRVKLIFKANSDPAYFEGFYYDPGVGKIGNVYGDYVYTLAKSLADIYGSVANSGIALPDIIWLDSIRNTFLGPVTSSEESTDRREIYYQSYPSYQSATAGRTIQEVSFPGVVRAVCTTTGTYSLSVTSNLRYICTNGKLTYYIDSVATATSSSCDIEK